MISGFGELKILIVLPFCYRSGFPGSQPVSMDTKNIALLGEKPYRVSWKADGTRYTHSDVPFLLHQFYAFMNNIRCSSTIFVFCFRYMMLILRKNEIFFLDRDNSVFQVENLRFPMRKDPQRHIENTLLDGVRPSKLLRMFTNIYFVLFFPCSFTFIVMCITLSIILRLFTGNGYRQDRKW